LTGLIPADRLFQVRGTGAARRHNAEFTVNCRELEAKHPRLFLDISPREVKLFQADGAALRERTSRTQSGVNVIALVKFATSSKIGAEAHPH